MKKKILVLSHDKVGPSMAGPGIRYHQISTHLSRNYDVTLGVFNPSYVAELENTSYDVVDIHVQHFSDEFSKYDVIIALWLSDEMIEYSKQNNIVIIFDLYAPVPVEDLVQRVFGDKKSKESDYDYRQMLGNYSHFIRNADFALTSNIQQRDFWLGYSFASDKTRPTLQFARPIESFYGICPMGIDLNEIKNIEPELLSEKIPSLKQNDFVLAWTGGIWDWFDGITPIKAMKLIQESGRDDIKLVFLGTKHPNDDVPAMKETDLARDLAKKLRLLNKSVFFLDGWLPYDQRTRYLRRANVAIYNHKPSIESRFSHRTRVLDHILMKLPTIATEGDYLSDYMSAYGLGLAVKPFNAQETAKAILELSDNKNLLTSMQTNIDNVQQDFTWDATLKDLDDFLSSDYCKSSQYVNRSETFKSVSTAHPLVRISKKVLPRPVKKIIKRVVG